jgi:hypothetical protein
MKKLATLGLAMACLTPAFAQENPYSLAVHWDFRTKTTNAVVLRQIGLIKRPFGAAFDLEVDGFAGSDIETNLVAGFSIGKTFPVAENVDFKFGVAVSTQENRPTGAGLLLGLTVRF